MRQIILSICVLLLVGLACQRAEKLPASQGASISGTVDLEDSDDDGGATVVATLEAAGTTSSGITNSQGAYRIEDLEPGLYRVEASKTGYETRTREHVEVLAGRETSGIDFVLAEKPKGEPDDIREVSGGSPVQQGTVGEALEQDFVVEVLDAFDDPVQGVRILYSITAPTPGGRMQNESDVYTDAEGRAANRCILATLAGDNVIDVRADGLEGDHVEFSAVGLPDAPNTIVKMTGDNQAGIAGQDLPEQVEVQILDRYTNPVPDQLVVFQPSDEGTATPDLNDTDSDGLASTTWLLGGLMGPQTLTVHCPPAQSIRFDAQADHDFKSVLVVLAGNNQNGLINVTYPQPLVVAVRDRHQNPVDGEAVTFTFTAGSGSFSPAGPQSTGVSGEAQVSVTPTSAGAIEVTASAAGLTPAVFHLTSLTGSPDHIVVVGGQGQSGVVGMQLPSPIMFRVEDAANNPLEGVILHVEAGSTGGATGSVSDADMPTDGNGMAYTLFTLGTLAGTDTQFVTASLPGFGSVVPAEVRATALADEPAVVAVVSGDNQSASYGELLPEPLVARLADEYDNPVRDYSVDWSSDAGGSVAPNPSTTGVDGTTSVQATMGSTPGQPEQHFTCTANGFDATFTASVAGFHADLLVPRSVWPGYPDPDHPSPQDLWIDMHVYGGGFEPGSVVVWDSGGSAEDITPVTIDLDHIHFQLSADHVSAGEEGTYLVSIRDTGGTTGGALPFDVRTSAPDTGQTASQCTRVSAPDWAWASCSTIQPGESLWGQDGHYLPPDGQPGLVNNLDGTVTDDVTLLMWQRCVAGQSGLSCAGGGQKMITSEAVSYCENLELAGFSDWRLPSIQELQGVANFGVEPAFVPGAFPNIPDEFFGTFFLSSTSHHYTPAEDWTIDPDDGMPQAGTGLAEGGFARCVRQGAPMDGVRFIRRELIGGQPVVEDHATGLVWQGCNGGLSGADCTDGTALEQTWTEALSYCETLSWGSFDDWRLPQVKELFGLVDVGADTPAIDVDAFPATRFAQHWTSTTYLPTQPPVDAWAVHFWDGSPMMKGKDDSTFSCVRCVRGGL